MKFKNGKLEETKHKVNTFLLSEFLDENIQHKTERSIICNHYKKDDIYHLDTIFIHRVKSNNGIDFIIDLMFDYNFEIENDDCTLDDDKIDLFKHFDMGAKKVWTTATNNDRSLPYEQNKNINIPIVCDEVVEKLINNGYYI
ncbi:MAG TPA: hypothetical protein VGI43_19270 [Mucilaginibacter sp.]|jgi:hypothetical protein